MDQRQPCRPASSRSQSSTIWSRKPGTRFFIDQAEAIGVFVAPGLLAITNYKFHLSGETGRFKDAHGDMSAIGEADFNAGHLIGRYTGRLCTVASGTP